MRYYSGLSALVQNEIETFVLARCDQINDFPAAQDFTASGAAAELVYRIGVHRKNPFRRYRHCSHELRRHDSAAIRPIGLITIFTVWWNAYGKTILTLKTIDNAKQQSTDPI